MDHDAYVRFMWDACDRRPAPRQDADRVGGGRRGEAARGHDRPALVRRRARPRRRRAGPAADHVARAAHLPRPEVRRRRPSSASSGPATSRSATPTSGTRPRSSPRRDVLGVEAALWTETTETRDDVDSMVFPRLAAVAEVGWSARARLGGLPRHGWPPTARCCASWA